MDNEVEERMQNEFEHDEEPQQQGGDAALPQELLGAGGAPRQRTRGGRGGRGGPLSPAQQPVRSGAAARGREVEGAGPPQPQVHGGAAAPLREALEAALHDAQEALGRRDGRHMKDLLETMSRRHQTLKK
jgi:hypothetical protein